MNVSNRAEREAPQNATSTAMSVTQVRFGYQQGSEIIRAVTGELKRGRICCLIGPNAAGKSTLLKLMLGQLPPWSGSVTLDGQDVSAMKLADRAKRISYVPQRGMVSFAFTVRQVVAMGTFAGGDNPQAVERALAQCDLTGLAGRAYCELSGGQQQRVLIARAMAQAQQAGQVMLLDEPGSSLDIWHVHQLMRMLREQADAGLAVLVVIHDLNLAARYADDIWLMDDGQMVAAGPWQQVLQPAVLEPVYRVKLEAMRTQKSDRPVFLIEPADTL